MYATLPIIYCFLPCKLSPHANSSCSTTTSLHRPHTFILRNSNIQSNLAPLAKILIHLGQVNFRQSAATAAMAALYALHPTLKSPSMLGFVFHSFHLIFTTFPVNQQPLPPWLPCTYCTPPPHPCHPPAQGPTNFETTPPLPTRVLSSSNQQPLPPWLPCTRCTPHLKSPSMFGFVFHSFHLIFTTFPGNQQPLPPWLPCTLCTTHSKSPSMLGFVFHSFHLIFTTFPGNQQPLPPWLPCTYCTPPPSVQPPTQGHTNSKLSSPPSHPCFTPRQSVASIAMAAPFTQHPTLPTLLSIPST